MPPFTNHVVIITGASTGIGAEMARQLSRQNAKVVVAARNGPLLNTLIDECAALGGEAIAVRTDVGDKAACETLVKRAVEQFGRIDMLVNNAAVSTHFTFDELESLETVDRIIATNLLGCIYPTFYALPHLKASRGRVLAVNSVLGRAGAPRRTIYAASKHGMTGFHDALRIEVEPGGVSITQVFPDFVATGMHARLITRDGTITGKNTTVDYSKVMNTEKAAALILNAAAKRKRELIMSSRGRVGMWLKLIAPRMLDNIARRGIQQGR